MAKQNGVTPMYIAAQNGHVEIVRVLLEAGADANKADEIGRTPMHVAARNAQSEVAVMLSEFVLTQREAS